MNLNKLKHDTSGGIEGLPLQLMIMILVATLGTAIILGWMGNIDSPHYIGEVTVNPTGVLIQGGTLEDFEVTVFDESGNPLENAFIYVENDIIVSDTDDKKPTASTDSFGKATFTGLKLKNVSYKTVTVHLNVSAPGYNEKTLDVMAVVA